MQRRKRRTSNAAATLGDVASAVEIVTPMEERMAAGAIAYRFSTNALSI